MKILFLKIAEPYGCFSNFSKHPIVVNGKEWKTTEAYYQAQKYEDPELQEKVRLAVSPWVAAQIGRDPSLPLRKDWDQVKERIMKEALWLKVSLHKEVKDTLLSTDNNELMEHTPRDHYWADGGDGSGKNRLGILWMEIREELRKSI
jgi:ribA/ribD-fused uncharacterized protein